MVKLAARRPVVVLLENINFIDPQSMDFLQQWLVERHPLPLLGLASGRPGPHTSRLQSCHTVQTVELKELDERARRDMVLRRFEDPDQARVLTESIVSRTGGNPLFIDETIGIIISTISTLGGQRGVFLVIVFG